MLAFCRRIYRSTIPEPIRGAVRNLLGEKGYSRVFFDWLDQEQAASYRIVANTIVENFHPGSVIDVGCGSGRLLAELRDRGIARTEGLESSSAALEQCRKHGLSVRKFDLARPFRLDAEIDLAICLEVAEHLAESVADEFICSLTSGPRNIVFSAATPGQGGEGHVNEQPHNYWVAKFNHHEFRLDEEYSLNFRTAWQERSVVSWYTKNVMIFRKNDETSK